MTEIIPETTTQFPNSLKDFNHFWISEGVIVFLDDDGISVKHLLLDEILKDSFVRKNYPRDYIENQINKIISSAFKIPLDKRQDFLKKKIEEFQEELEKGIHDWVILIPIENFKLDKTWSIGDIKFYPANAKNINKNLALFRNNLQKNKHYTDEEKEIIVDLQKRLLTDSFKGIIGSFAEVKIRGIADVAQQEAMNRLRLILNVIRLFNLPNEESQRIFFGISGEIIQGKSRYTMRYTNDKRNLNPVIERTGYIFPFELNEKKVQFMRENGFNKLKKILSITKKTNFQNRLLTSIYWYGEAINSDISYDEKKVLENFNKEFGNLEYFNLNLRFIKLITALESLLLFDENEPIQNNIAERSAFLLSKKFEERKEIKKTIKTFYKKRSRVVHHGEGSISISDLYYLSFIVQNVIFILIKKMDVIPLRKTEDLHQYLERIKLS